MSNNFTATFYTLKRLSDVETLRELWQLLDDSLVSPQRFGAVERPKTPFEPNSVEVAAQIFRDEGMLFVRGKKDGFLGFFQQQPKGLSTWRIYLNSRAMESSKRDRWLTWLFNLCEQLPVLFGYGCTIEEYDAKHTYVQMYDNGGTATGAIGVAVRNFYQYLPGLYWLTVFGPELVEAFGRSKLEALPDVEVVTIGSNQIAIRLAEPIVPDNMGHRLHMESQLAAMLGEEFFFDRHKTNLTYKQAPQLSRALQSAVS